MVIKTETPFDPTAARGLYGPAWRQHQARKLPDKISEKRASGQDSTVLAYWSFLTLSSSSTDGELAAQAAYPQFAAAIHLDGDLAVCEKLKCMVLADLPRAEMAERLLLDGGVIEMWELLFFDVRPALKARDWVWGQVIEPQWKAGDVNGAARLHLAFAGGAVVGRCLLAAESELPLDNAERLIDSKLRMEMKLREAYDVPVVGEKHAIAILNLAKDLRRIELEEQKLAQLTLEASRRHELSVRRLDLMEERMKQEAAARRDRPPHGPSKPKANSEVSPLQRQAAADMAHFNQGLARLAMENRIANSPLSKLTWAQPKAKPKPQPTAQKKARPTVQKKAQPTAQKKAQPTVQKKVQPTVQKKVQPTAQKKVQPTAQKKVQPTAQKKVQPTAQKKVQPPAQPKAQLKAAARPPRSAVPCGDDAVFTRANRQQTDIASNSGANEELWEADLETAGKRDVRAAELSLQEV